jgi:ACT domain
VETFVVRVWLPDRPGALGQVASRIGAVRGDVVGIEIIERGGGRAIDELVVRLPDADLLDLLITEVKAVDGAAVEDVRPAPGTPRDPRLDALEAAADLMAASAVPELLDATVARAAEELGAAWVALVDGSSRSVTSSSGLVPALPWLLAFLEGSRSSAAVAAGDAGPDELACAELAAAEAWVVVGRPGRSLRSRERRLLAALARLADARWAELVRRAPARAS